jgi:hypothetical protein
MNVGDTLTIVDQAGIDAVVARPVVVDRARSAGARLEFGGQSTLVAVTLSF